jgi:pimeloyl-ACP methyl ester carboxylesterase
MDRQATVLAGSTIETADGTHLYFRDWGEGRPVVFLASWSLPSESWSYQMLALALHGYRAIAYDRRGPRQSCCRTPSSWSTKARRTASPTATWTASTWTCWRSWRAEAEEQCESASSLPRNLSPRPRRR